MKALSDFTNHEVSEGTNHTCQIWSHAGNSDDEDSDSNREDSESNSDDEDSASNSDDEDSAGNSDAKDSASNSDDEDSESNSDDEDSAGNSDDEDSEGNSDDEGSASNRDDEDSVIMGLSSAGHLGRDVDTVRTRQITPSLICPCDRHSQTCLAIPPTVPFGYAD